MNTPTVIPFRWNWTSQLAWPALVNTMAPVFQVNCTANLASQLSPDQEPPKLMQNSTLMISHRTGTQQRQSLLPQALQLCKLELQLVLLAIWEVWVANGGAPKVVTPLPTQRHLLLQTVSTTSNATVSCQMSTEIKLQPNKVKRSPTIVSLLTAQSTSTSPPWPSGFTAPRNLPNTSKSPLPL